MAGKNISRHFNSENLIPATPADIVGSPGILHLHHISGLQQPQHPQQVIVVYGVKLEAVGPVDNRPSTYRVSFINWSPPKLKSLFTISGT